MEAGRGVRKLPAQPVQPGINRFASNAGAVVSLNRMMSEPSGGGGLAPVSAAGMSMSAGGQTAVRPNVLQGVAGTNGFHGAAAGTQPLPQGTHQRSYCQAFSLDVFLASEDSGFAEKLSVWTFSLEF